jgi:hypothetical protein
MSVSLLFFPALLACRWYERADPGVPKPAARGLGWGGQGGHSISDNGQKAFCTQRKKETHHSRHQIRHSDHGAHLSELGGKRGFYPVVTKDS